MTTRGEQYEEKRNEGESVRDWYYDHHQGLLQIPLFPYTISYNQRPMHIELVLVGRENAIPGRNMCVNSTSGLQPKGPRE